MWQCQRPPEGITIEEWKNFIDNLKNVFDTNMQIQFVGGEPLMRRDIFELIEFTSGKGFSTTMTTNGYMIDRVTAKRIVDSGLTTLVLSLDSFKEETHDFLRGQKGAYRKAMEALDILAGLKGDFPHIHVVATIMGPNIDDLEDLTEWANREAFINSISFQAIMQPFYTPPDDRWYKKEEFSFLWPKDVEKVKGVIRMLISLKERGYKINNPILQLRAFEKYFLNPEGFVKNRCNLGYNSLTVNSYGKVFLCLALEPIGTLKEPLYKIWHSEKAEKVRKKITTCKNNCKSLINCFFEEENS